MIPQLILLVSLGVFWWLIKRDIVRRPAVSATIWIPTLWVGIISSRPLSMWFAYGGGDSTMEGSPLDRLGFFILIGAAWYTLARRRVAWQPLISRNWAIFLFYGFLLFSVLWANSPFVSFKRWFKEFGNILVALVILTETEPQEAFRAVFVRCAYVLVPLSEIFIRWFPELGRRYNIHNGEMEAIGVTGQKNSLGALVLVCGLVLLWDWLETFRNSAQRAKKQRRLDYCIYFGLLSLGAYLLNLCDSKTSMLCLGICGGILLTTRVPVFRQRLPAFGAMVLLLAVSLFLLDQAFDIKEKLVRSLGRDMTFTGRTDVWRELLDLHTDPALGTGFMSFWDDPQYRNRLPYWVAFSAHNGYMEVYLAGGFAGVSALALMLLATGIRVHRALSWGGDYAVVRYACYIAVLVTNFSESNFACMTPVGFLFLLAAIGHAESGLSVQVQNSLGTSAAQVEEAQPISSACSSLT